MPWSSQHLTTSNSWDPHTNDDINTLEKVQSRGARFVCNNYTGRAPGYVIIMLESHYWITLTSDGTISASLCFSSPNMAYLTLGHNSLPTSSNPQRIQIFLLPQNDQWWLSHSLSLDNIHAVNIHFILLAWMLYGTS